MLNLTIQLSHFPSSPTTFDYKFNVPSLEVAKKVLREIRTKHPGAKPLGIWGQGRERIFFLEFVEQKFVRSYLTELKIQTPLEFLRLLQRKFDHVMMDYRPGRRCFVCFEYWEYGQTFMFTELISFYNAL